MITVRTYQPGDAPGLRACVVALQDFERTLDPRLRTGDEIADAYCVRIHERCRSHRGQVFVAAEGAEVVGFVAVLAEVPFTELDDPPGSYGLVSDLAVLPKYEGQGAGRRLLERAEAFAREQGASALRIGVLAGNARARRLYDASGFGPCLEIMSKPLR